MYYSDWTPALVGSSVNSLEHVPALNRGVCLYPQKCPYWLEVVAQHAMDYCDDPILLVGQQMDDGLVATVGWGNCTMNTGSEVKV